MWNNINVTHMPESLMPESISMTNMAPLHAASANIKLRRGSGSSHTRQQQKFVLRPNLCDVSHWQQCLTTQSTEITSNQAAVSAPNKLFFFSNSIIFLIWSQSSSWFVDLSSPCFLSSIQNALLCSTCFFISCDLLGIIDYIWTQTASGQRQHLTDLISSKKYQSGRVSVCVLW